MGSVPPVAPYTPGPVASIEALLAHAVYRWPEQVSRATGLPPQVVFGLEAAAVGFLLFGRRGALIAGVGFPLVLEGTRS